MAINKTNVNIIKQNGENPAMMLKRFSSKMKEFGIIPRVKSTKYFNRKDSPLRVRKAKLIKLEGEKIYNFKKKMGKIVYKKKFNAKPQADKKPEVKAEIKIEAPKS
jgi:hypothetical protein